MIPLIPVPVHDGNLNLKRTSDEKEIIKWLGRNRTSFMVVRTIVNKSWTSLMTSQETVNPLLQRSTLEHANWNLFRAKAMTVTSRLQIGRLWWNILISNWPILSIYTKAIDGRSMYWLVSIVGLHIEERMQHSIACSLPGFKVPTGKGVKIHTPRDTTEKLLG